MTNIHEYRSLMVFIVGNSRSGTTMLGRVLGNHTDIYTFNELHFFEELWDTKDRDRILSPDDAVKLASHLLGVYHDGYFHRSKGENHIHEAETIIGAMKERALTAADVFEEFLFHFSGKHGKSIPCEKTPRNVFYIEEVLSLFPNARVVNMIRDPRDVLLSQKRKWRRRYLGGKTIPLREEIRSWINYHPILISRLWNSSIGFALKWKNDSRVFYLRFEDFIAHPENRVRELCTFFQIPFSEKMLHVPWVGSSSRIDSPDIKGIDKSRAGNWRRGGVNPTEVYLCEKIAKRHMEKYGYSIENYKPNPFLLMFYALLFPLKLILAFALNIQRIKKIKEAVMRRFILREGT